MKLSIITINFNNRDGLRKTIGSVVSQTLIDYEYIIIDGASTDGSVDVIKENKDKIAYWISEPDKGIYNAMNKGILQAKGEYCLFLNSGDFLYSNDILSLVFSKEYNRDILYGDIFVIASDRTYRISTPEKLNMHFFYTNSLMHPAAFIKRYLFEIELYNENFEAASDWEFFMKRYLNGYSFEKIPYVVSFFDRVSLINRDKDICGVERAITLGKLIPEYIIPDYNDLSLCKSIIPDNAFESLEMSPKLRTILRSIINMATSTYRFMKKVVKRL